MSNAFRDKITNDLSQASKQKEDLTTVAELVRPLVACLLTNKNMRVYDFAVILAKAPLGGP